MMVRALLSLLVALVLAPPAAEALPISFSAEVTERVFLGPQGLELERIEIGTGSRRIAVPPSPLQLSVPHLFGFFTQPGIELASRVDLSLVLQTQDKGVLGGFRTSKFLDENRASLVRCTKPNTCRVAEENTGFFGPFDPRFIWPLDPILQEVFLSGEPFPPLLIPRVPDGALVATIQFSASPHPMCFDPTDPSLCVTHAEASFTLNPVPEPTTVLLFGTTAAGLGLARWRQRRRKVRLPS